MISDGHKAPLFEVIINGVRGCDLCPRMRASERIFGRSSGQLAAPLMFIGEAPGRLGADDTSIPFHGDRAGENFEKLIAQVGISRYDCFITNAVLCNPKDEKGNNATPSRREIENCSGFLKAQIDLIDPKIIVTLGSQSLQALKLIEAHSYELSEDVRKARQWMSRTLIPLYHPGQRAMIHRSFLNQLADYKFVAEQLRRLRGGRKSAKGGQTSAEATNVVRALLAIAGPISYFRLHKLFYLLEYHHIRRSSKRLTASYAIRQKDGPYFTDLHLSKLRKAMPELSIQRGNGTIFLSLGKSNDLFDTIDIDGTACGELRDFITDIVDRYRMRTDDQLKTAVYLTAPMRKMLRREKYEGANLFNAPIDFSAA